jgi:predicted O-methyltransferase YrrM
MPLRRASRASGHRGARRDNAAMPAGPDRWAAVDRYLADRLLARDEALDAALAASAAAGLPAQDVSPLQGALLELLARVQGARTILELGTLGGYSTIWLAPALPPAAGW